MSHRVRTWYSIVNKIMAIISIALALLVIADCSFVIASVSKEPTNGTVVDENKSATKTYNTIVIVCASMTMVCALAQFFLSLKMSLSCSRRAGIAMKIWISAHLIAFCITLFCILLPLFYPKPDGKPQHDTFLKDAHKLIKNPKKILADKSNYMVYYFLGLITNGSFLLLFLIFTGCFLRCGQFDDYDQLKE